MNATLPFLFGTRFRGAEEPMLVYSHRQEFGVGIVAARTAYGRQAGRQPGDSSCKVRGYRSRSVYFACEPE
jgi:hypothetical protein